MGYYCTAVNIEWFLHSVSYHTTIVSSDPTAVCTAVVHILVHRVDKVSLSTACKDAPFFAVVALEGVLL